MTDTIESLRARVAELGTLEYDYEAAIKHNVALQDELAALKTSQQAAREAGQGDPVGYIWYEPASDWNGYEGHERIGFKKPINSECAFGYQAVFTQAPTIPAAREHKRFASEYEEGVTTGWNACLDELLAAAQAPTIPAGMKLVNANGLAEAMALFVPHECYGEMDALLAALKVTHWDEERMDIIGQNGNSGLHYLGD